MRLTTCTTFPLRIGVTKRLIMVPKKANAKIQKRMHAGRTLKTEHFGRQCTPPPPKKRTPPPPSREPPTCPFTAIKYSATHTKQIHAEELLPKGEHDRAGNTSLIDQRDGGRNAVHTLQEQQQKPVTAVTRRVSQ